MDYIIRGLLQAGNINLYDRPRVMNPDGSISTVNSMSFGDDRGEVLVPTIGKEAGQRGRHLGIFDTPEHASAYAKKLHEAYAAGKLDVPLATSRRSIDPNQLEMVLKGLLKVGPYINPYNVE